MFPQVWMNINKAVCYKICWCAPLYLKQFIMSILLSLMGDFLRIAQKNNRWKFERNMGWA